MTLNILNVVYVLIAAAMIGFILVQRGAGAQAGSGFGGGASATVFGARGASNFLTKTTAVLASLFFVLSLVMGILISRGSSTKTAAELGVMADHATAPAKDAPKDTKMSHKHKAEFLSAVGEALGLPSDYGQNLDALAERLGDLGSTVLLWDGWSAFARAEEVPFRSALDDRVGHVTARGHNLYFPIPYRTRCVITTWPPAPR